VRWSIALGSPPCPCFPRRVVQLLALLRLLRHFRTVLFADALSLHLPIGRVSLAHSRCTAVIPS